MPQARLFRPTRLAEAVAILGEHAGSAAPLAGATWMMRAPIRGEAGHAAYVALGGIDALRQVTVTEGEVALGAAVTHAALVAALAGLADCAGLASAAAMAANPAIRQVATLGGNLCAASFAAADLVPALLCLDAVVDLASPQGEESLDLAEFLLRRPHLAPGTVLSRVRFARRAQRTAHIRLPLRKAGDYPVAIVSLAVRHGADGQIATSRVAVGSVEPVARRWPAVEAALTRLDPEAAAEAARAHAGDWQGRDGVEAPGWYRVQVLPALLRRAVHRLGDRS